jgi:hypothetical protein
MSRWFWGIKGTMAKLTNLMIEAAIRGFDAQKKDIDGQIAELRAMMTGAPAPADNSEAAPAKSAGKLKGRKLSAAVRARMKAAQQLRWAKVKGTAPDPTVKAPTKMPAKAPAAKTPLKTPRPKPHFSPEARKRLSIMMKKRWAAKKVA